MYAYVRSLHMIGLFNWDTVFSVRYELGLNKQLSTEHRTHSTAYGEYQRLSYICCKSLCLWCLDNGRLYVCCYGMEKPYTALKVSAVWRKMFVNFTSRDNKERMLQKLCRQTLTCSLTGTVGYTCKHIQFHSCAATVCSILSAFVVIKHKSKQTWISKNKSMFKVSENICTVVTRKKSSFQFKAARSFRL
jgi:hypothetical protein